MACSPRFASSGSASSPTPQSARGFLSGTILSLEGLAPDDVRRAHPRFQGDNLRKNLELVERVKRVADEKGVKPGQVALAWVLAQGEDVVPIPGTKRRTYLQENIQAVNVKLSEDEMQALDEAAPSGAAARPLRGHDSDT